MLNIFTDYWTHSTELRYRPDWGGAAVKQCITNGRLDIMYSRHCTYQLAAGFSKGEFMRPLASVSVLSMANSFNCLLQATDSTNNFFLLLLLLLHNHVYRVNPCGSRDSFLLQMIKPCQNSTKETMNTKQALPTFPFIFRPNCQVWKLLRREDD